MLGLFGRILWHQRLILAWLGLLALLACGWAWWKRDVIAAYFENRNQRNQVREEVRALEAERQRLEHEREVLLKGGFASEKVARETYHMSKPGEKVLRLSPSPRDEETPASATLRQR